MSIDYESLNANQQTAVGWTEGALLVLAGPGSGKTRVLTMRVARLLSESAAERFRVLGLTFTSKAAAEMRERVEQLVPDQRHRAQLTTFHSFAADVLRQHGASVGIDPNFTILTQDEDRVAVLRETITAARKAGANGQREALEWADHSDLDREPRELLRLLDHRFAQGYDADPPIALKGKPDWFGPLFDAYVDLLVESNRADFPTLLWLCHRLLAERRAVVRQLRLVFKYVCVDEFQDTNLAQYKLLTALVGFAPANLFVVADDDQIIYQWNGASPERLAKLRADYSMQVVQLPENYRCPPDVLELANNLIAHNRSRAPGKLPLVARKPPMTGDSYRIYKFSGEDDEAAWVAKDILERRLDPANCAVLARTNRLIERVAEASRRQGVPAHIARRKAEFESAPFRWLHGVLRLANERHNVQQLRRVSKAWFDLTSCEIRPEDVAPQAVVLGGDFLRAWVDAAREQGTDNTRLLDLVQPWLVERVEFLRFVEEAVPLLVAANESLGGAGFSDFEEELATWHDLKQRIIGQHGRSEVTLHQYLQELDLESKAPPPPPGALRCMTIHGSKGLEFDHVYIVGLVEDELPSFQARRRGDDSREMEEERRNCFVAITRVQSTLTMSFADSYRGWTKDPSRFLTEMGFSLD